MKSLEAFARIQLGQGTTGHGWFHADRVRRMALALAHREGGNPDFYVVEAAALLHDVPDRKVCPDSTKAMLLIREALDQAQFSPFQTRHIEEIISGISFQGAQVETRMRTLEGKVVQDADRLDALGAIGIARCFAYGGRHARPIYDPEQAPVAHANAAAYFSSQGSSINHFHEKLLLLKDRMQTKNGKAVAENRHRFLEQYLEQFEREWTSADLPR
ncbi:MAG TPA: HD domain-containing protein [Fibrobacteraceae bacterium]|nr:HD domain-containing protein [Fibrobacteraceae bacterium]